MQITKKQAKAWNIFSSRLCDYHERFPDQAASMYSCMDCKLILDPCGCDQDSFCDQCDPDLARLARKVLK